MQQALDLLIEKCSGQAPPRACSIPRRLPRQAVVPRFGSEGRRHAGRRKDDFVVCKADSWSAHVTKWLRDPEAEATRVCLSGAQQWRRCGFARTLMRPPTPRHWGKTINAWAGWSSQPNTAGSIPWRREGRTGGHRGTHHGSGRARRGAGCAHRRGRHADRLLLSATATTDVAEGQGKNRKTRWNPRQLHGTLQVRGAPSRRGFTGGRPRPTGQGGLRSGCPLQPVQLYPTPGERLGWTLTFGNAATTSCRHRLQNRKSHAEAQ